MKTNLIGISGRIGSGKDEICKIWRYLDAVNNNGYTGDYENFDPIMNCSQWEVRKFAGKLKQIVSLLMGISVELLEDQQIKNMTLEEAVEKKYISEIFYKYISSE